MNSLRTGIDQHPDIKNADVIFQEDDNCWRESFSTFATPLIDCANFFKALHESICKAQHSIFIVGWDIDSRVKLLHGEDEAQSEAPSVISDLIQWKAENTPDLKVYLIRWDSSFAFFSKRELWAHQVWDEKTPDNVQVILDDTIPMGGSQHQKIVVIDDELAFSGGMDIATQRWDTRDHPVKSPERDDDRGPYGPFHDVQVVMAGPVVESLAELVRWRWDRISDTKAIPKRKFDSDTTKVPPSWPSSFKPALDNLPCAIARTIPLMDDVEPAQEVRQMLLSLIRSAKSFIYIENQFATREEIAKELNAQLLKNKNLKVLIVSTYEPKSTVEREAYWASRIEFKNILEAGIRPHRVALAYSSITDSDGEFAHKRIHSKVLVVDNKYLVIGSSNLSNRSMTLDTEADVIFSATEDRHFSQIENIRNDLVAEHAGLDIKRAAKILRGRNPISKLLRKSRRSGYCLSETKDELFTSQSWRSWFLPFSDPDRPIVEPLPWLNGKFFFFRNPRRKTILFSLLFTIFAVLLGGAVLASHYIPWLNGDSLSAFLETTRGSVWAIPAVCAVYIIAGLFFFPVTVLSLAVAAVFGPVWGPVYGIMGALLSTATLFYIGRLMGDRGLRNLAGAKVKVVDEKFADSGIVGVAALRLIPVAPFSLVNLIAGISSIGLTPFLIGTFLGMFPPMIAKGLVGDSLTKIFSNPSPQTIGYLAGGIICWILMIVGSQKLVRYLQSNKTAGPQDVESA